FLPMLILEYSPFLLILSERCILETLKDRPWYLQRRRPSNLVHGRGIPCGCPAYRRSRYDLSALPKPGGRWRKVLWCLWITYAHSPDSPSASTRAKPVWCAATGPVSWSATTGRSV